MKATVQQLSPSSKDQSFKQTPYKSQDNFNGSRSSMSQFKKSLQSSMLSPSENQATVRVSISGNKKSLRVQDNESYDYYLGIYKEDLAQERQKNFMLNEKIKELKEFNERFNPGRILDLEQEIQTRDNDIQKLANENEEFRRGLEEASELQGMLEKFQHENSILKNQNKLLQNEVSLLNQKLSGLDELESNCNQLNQEYQSLLQQNEQVSNDYELVSEDYSQLRSKLDSVLSENQRLGASLDETVKAKKNLESRIALYSGQITTLESRADQVSAVESQNIELKTQLKAFEQELLYFEEIAQKHDEADAELTKCRSLIEDYKEGLQEADTQVVHLKDKLSENLEWREKFFEAEKKLSQLMDANTELKKLKSAFTISDRANNQLLSENSILVNNNEAIKFKLEAKEKEVERLLQACNRNEETIEKLIKDNEELSGIVRKCEQTIESTANQLKEKEKSISNLNFQNSQILADNKTLEDKNKELDSANHLQRNSIIELQTQLHSLLKESENLKGSSHEIVKERDYLKGKFTGIEDKLTKVTALEFELEKTKAKLNVSETLRTSTQNQLQEIMGKYKLIKEEANLYEKFQILLQKNEQLGDLLDEQNTLAEKLQSELGAAQKEKTDLASVKVSLEQELKKIKENLAFWQEKYMKATKTKV